MQLKFNYFAIIAAVVKKNMSDFFQEFNNLDSFPRDIWQYYSWLTSLFSVNRIWDNHSDLYEPSVQSLTNVILH